MKLLLAATLLLAGCAAAPRPLPPADRCARLDAAGEEVLVYRDGWGIPHVFAKTPRGAFWAEGWVEAEDRIGQMDVFRRASRGRGSELAGKAGVANDRDRRRRGYTEPELREMIASGSARFRGALSAYAAGVNAWLAAHPREGTAPWAETDSLAIAVAMSRRFGEGGEVELASAQVHAHLVKKVGEEDARKIVADLLRERDDAAPTTMHDHARVSGGKEKGKAGGPGMSDAAWAAYVEELDAIRASRAALGMPVYFGSNAWVAGPRKSSTGNPMIYGGPMMGFTTPSICNEIHLVAEGLNAAGMSFPGAPGVLIGWNERLAWTTTSGGSDLVDVYALELNPENPEEYRYRGAWKPFDVREETIEVKGEAPQKVTVRRWVHGPVVGESDLKALRVHGLRMAYWKAEQRTFEGVLDLGFASTMEEFETGVRKIATSHNFFCATRDGRIGFWYCGAHPVRKTGHDPRFPQDGSGGMEWEGFLPPEKWPSQVDPARGWFANWNNKPTASWPNVGFGEIFWGKKIIDDLEAEGTITPERFAAIARRTAYHGFVADYFAPFILDAAQGSDDPEVRRAGEILAAWDRQEREGDAAPVILDRWVRAAMARLFGGLIDPMMLASRDLQRYLADPMLYTFQGERSRVKLKYDYAKGRDLKALARDALKDAVKGGVDSLAWKEPEIDFKGPAGKVTSKSGRGTFQMMVEMTPDGPRAATSAPPGQSERPDSRHSTDQVPLFGKWDLKPFVWRVEEMK